MIQGLQARRRRNERRGFYLLHFFVVHLMAIVYSQARYGVSGWWIRGQGQWPTGYAPRLFIAFAAWLLLLAMLFPACRRFERLKANRDDWWLRYL